MDGGPRPQCGGGSGATQEYDLPLHVAALFLVLAFSAMGCGFPVVAKKFPAMKIPPGVFFFCKHFGTGVLVATAFVHLIPTAFESLTDPCLPPLFTEKYPALPGAIMLFSLFSLFCLEMYLNSKVGGHSHGGATIGDQDKNVKGNPGISWPKENSVAYSGRESLDSIEKEKALYADEKKPPAGVYPPRPGPPTRPHRPGPPPSDFDHEYRLHESQMPPWFVAFYEQYIRERERMRTMVQAAMQLQHTAYAVTNSDVDVMEEKQRQQQAHGDDLERANPDVDPDVLKRMSLNITILEGGILFHSVFVGITVSIETDGFIVLLIAILFHQAFEGLGLGSRIAAVPYPRGSLRPWILVLAFGTTAPIGQAIGLAARSSYDPESAFALVLVGTFNALSSGLLIYAALVDLLAEDFLSEEGQRMTKSQKISGFVYILMGAAGMSIVGAFA